jgi:hypothetical protein
MKKFIMFFFLFQTFYTLSAQQLQAEFQYTLVVEDARGKKDSVVLGYDRRSKQLMIDTAFGEFDIQNRPFDSVLEIRASEARNRFSVNYHSKRVVTYFEGDCAGIAVSSVATLLIRAKYYPIKFTWNSGIFTDKCRNRSVLVSNENYFQVEPGVNTQQQTDSLFSVAYLQRTSSKIEKFNKYTPGGQPNPYYYTSFLMPTNAGRNDTVWTYANVFQSGIIIPTKENVIQEIRSFPNPSFDELTVEIPNYEAGQIDVFDIMGRKVKSIKVESINQFKMDVKDLNHGLYLLKFKTNTEKIYVSKFVKS